MANLWMGANGRGYRIADGMKRPEGARHIPTIGDQQCRRHACLAQHVRREKGVLIGIPRTILAPMHGHPKIILQHCAHHCGERLADLGWSPAADQHRQPQTPLFPCRPGEALEGLWSDRIRLAGNIASSVVGRQHDDRARRRFGGKDRHRAGEGLDVVDQVIRDDRHRGQIQKGAANRRHDKAEPRPAPRKDEPDDRQQYEQIRRNQGRI
jgi:hypothetical protein